MEIIKNIINKISVRSLTVILFSLSLYFSMPFPVMADSEYDLIHRRINRLEKELAELKTLLKEKKAENQVIEHRPEKDNKKEVARNAAKPDMFQFKPYGYIKLDSSYDDSAVNNGDYIIYIPSEVSVRNDNEFNMTARQTRFGLDISAPYFRDWSTKGKVEIDFYGNGPAVHENKGEIVMRHAFLEMRKGNLEILAGQTWDVISPLNPSTLNYTVGWGGGNIGYRRPQIRLSYDTDKNKPMAVSAEFALARTSGLTNEDLDGGGQNDGEDSGLPTMQARMAIAAELTGKRRGVFGISGHYGKEEVDWAGSEKDIKSWSVNCDFTIPFYDRFTLKGEAFMGENLDDYFGGVIQGINTVSQKEISSRGMWAQVNFIPVDKWQYNTGFGIDDPDSQDINIGMRDRNMFYFANALFELTPPLTLGLEYSHWVTDYKNLDKGKDNRLQFSFIYSWK